MHETESHSLNFSVTVPRDPGGRGWCQAPPWAPGSGPVGLAVRCGIFPLLPVILRDSSEPRAQEPCGKWQFAGHLFLAPGSGRKVGRRELACCSSFLWEMVWTTEIIRTTGRGRITHFILEETEAQQVKAELRPRPGLAPPPHMARAFVAEHLESVPFMSGFCPTCCAHRPEEG